MIISISITEISREILAESALRHQLQSDAPKPLTPDSCDALRVLIKATFSRLIFELGPMVEDSSVSDDGELLQLTINENPVNAPQLRRAIEHLLALRVMCRAYAKADGRLALYLAEQAGSLLRTITEIPKPVVSYIPNRTY